MPGLRWICLLSAFLSAPAGARDWHVRTDGNDGNDGSLGAPLASLRRALQLAQPGDHVHIHAGTYFETQGSSAS